MAWTAPTLRITGELITATIWNTDLVANLLLLKTSISDDGATWTGVAQKTIQSFRGLRARTHPDQDVAASKLSLLNLDEVVMSDGSRYQPTASLPLAADITVAGAGGLDTGAEANSTWYEYYLIGKSSTGLASDLRLLLHKAKTYTIDTSFTTATNASRALRLATATATDRLAQGVQFASAGPLTFQDVIVQRQGAVSGRIWFSIQADSAGSPSGTPLATSDKLDAGALPAIATNVRIPFRTPFTVVAGTQYHLVMEGDYTRSDTVNVLLFGVAAGGYANGVGKEFNGTVWANASGVGDFWFKAALTLNTAAPTMPAGYDQTCKLGYVYNNSSGNFEPFIQSDRRLWYMTDHLMVSGSTTTNETLIDLSSVLPPGPIKVWGAAENTANASSVCVGPVPDGTDMRTTTLNHNVFQQQAAAANSMTTGLSSELLTELQGMYFRVNGGTGFVWITGFEWGN
jgi:hypothetical protein